MIDAEEVAERLAALHQRIERAGGDPDAIVVVGATKGHPADVASAALAAGIDHLGESYAQELAAKVHDVRGPVVPRWQFMGRLQRNKVRLVADHVDRWQSVDRASLVREIAKRAPGATVFVQVNATDEPQKGGCPPDEVDALVAHATDAGLVVDGLMAMGEVGDDDATRQAFRFVVDAADRLALPHRSIGMSGDLEVAVEVGTTMVRVGTDLFGPRPR